MVMFSDEWIARERYHDFLREAERRELVQLAIRTRHTVAWYGPGLAWLGRRFSGWGERLQMRYTMQPALSCHDGEWRATWER